MIVLERAHAKLNLTLGVLLRRADGYHEIDTLMQSVDLHDKIQIEKSRKVEVFAQGMELPLENTMYLAAKRYQKRTGCGALIRCEKHIPMEAGLGGGSADAAAVLRGLQKLHRMVSDKELLSIALSVGADVPFCLRGGLARCQGVGEVLTPFAAAGPLHFVLAKPPQGVSTRTLYAALPLPRPRVRTLAAMRELAQGDAAGLAPLLYNALEEPAIAILPEIETYKKRLLDAGALTAVMTGSGAAVFGLFASQEAAKRAEAELADLHWVRYCSSII
ncbi:MAG: 4-(cytidine 5'-diphospho)-2-C-methyl-D-erythritol kinase [Clostridiales bacterium]|nr:4-(cytidine 5'-diphospho)-2-C-methyl-D-erythritol kinase [Clostridiales bacterium]